MFKKVLVQDSRTEVVGKDRKKLKQALMNEFDSASIEKLFMFVDKFYLVKLEKSKMLVYSDETDPLFVDSSANGDFFPTLYALSLVPKLIPLRLTLASDVSDNLSKTPQLKWKNIENRLELTDFKQDQVCSLWKGASVKGVAASTGPDNKANDEEVAAFLLHFEGDQLWAFGSTKPKKVIYSGDTESENESEDEKETETKQTERSGADDFASLMKTNQNQIKAKVNLKQPKFNEKRELEKKGGKKADDEDDHAGKKKKKRETFDDDESDHEDKKKDKKKKKGDESDSEDDKKDNKKKNDDKKKKKGEESDSEDDKKDKKKKKGKVEDEKDKKKGKGDDEKDKKKGKEDDHKKDKKGKEDDKKKDKKKGDSDDEGHNKKGEVKKQAKKAKEESSSDEEEVPPVPPKEMDKAIREAFLNCVLLTVNDKELPIEGTELWKEHIVPCSNANFKLDIKHSSWKKLAKFLQVLAKENLIDFENGKVNEVIRNNKAFDDFEPTISEPKKKGQKGKKSDSEDDEDSGKKFEVNYTVSSVCLPSGVVKKYMGDAPVPEDICFEELVKRIKDFLRKAKILKGEELTLTQGLIEDFGLIDQEAEEEAEKGKPESHAADEEDEDQANAKDEKHRQITHRLKFDAFVDKIKAHIAFSFVVAPIDSKDQEKAHTYKGRFEGIKIITEKVHKNIETKVTGLGFYIKNLNTVLNYFKEEHNASGNIKESSVSKIPHKDLTLNGEFADQVKEALIKKWGFKESQIETIEKFDKKKKQ